MTKEISDDNQVDHQQPRRLARALRVVHYSTDPKNLSETAKSPIRLNPDHASTVFRVRLDNLKPGTTYYYTVGSGEANGPDDGTKSAVKQFTTPGDSHRAGRPRALGLTF